MRDFVHDLPATRVVFGAGRLADVAGEAARLGAERVLLVAGRREQGAADAVADGLGRRLAGRIAEVVVHVPAGVAAAAVEHARAVGADLVVTVGGGSATGLGKAIAKETGLRLLAVPTTFAGSELTPIWGLTQDGRKTTGRDPRVLPKVVVYDPRLLLGLPAGLAAASAMNALAHCVEALYAPQTSPLVPVLAEEGLRVLAARLPDLARTDLDEDAALDARADALYGAWIGGTVLGAATTGLHHRLAHVLGGTWDLPHAGVHSALLPYAAAWNLTAAPAARERAARALGGDPAGRLWDLARSAGAPTSLAEVGWTPASVDEAVDLVLAAPPANPRPVTAGGVREVLEAALAGRRPMEAGLGPPNGVAAEALTAEVLRRLDAAPDPRLREVLQSAVRHLHAFTREVGLRPDEWLAGIRFLTAVGDVTTEERQEFILLSDTLGLSSLVETIAHDAGDAATESTILGPFYVEGAPERELGETVAVHDPGGVPALMRGRVVSTDGTPLAAELDVWQTASGGRYDVQDPAQPRGNMRGRFRTRPDGTFEVRTSRPVSYPIPDDGPVGALLRATGRHPWRAAHIHVIVSAPGHQPVTTHLFDAENEYLDSDTVFGVRDSLVKRFEPQTDGSVLVEHEFVLRPSPS